MLVWTDNISLQKCYNLNSIGLQHKRELRNPNLDSISISIESSDYDYLDIPMNIEVEWEFILK